MKPKEEPAVPEVEALPKTEKDETKTKSPAKPESTRRKISAAERSRKSKYVKWSSIFLIPFFILLQSFVLNSDVFLDKAVHVMLSCSNRFITSPLVQSLRIISMKPANFHQFNVKLYLKCFNLKQTGC